MFTEMAKRKYTKRKRADQQAQTRQRIVEAAMALHEELGPRETSISAVAQRAGVQRLTVYRHFPDEASLLRACSGHWFELNPPPAPSRWQALAPEERGEATLAALYAYYRQTQEMLRSVYRDQDRVPQLAGPLQQFQDYLNAMRDDLIKDFKPAAANRKPLKAVLGHCLRFSTWQSLSEEGLSDKRLAALAMKWIQAVMELPKLS
jgi:AcrR family transcriptional regulator